MISLLPWATLSGFRRSGNHTSELFKTVVLGFEPPSVAFFIGHVTQHKQQPELDVVCTKGVSRWSEVLCLVAVGILIDFSIPCRGCELRADFGKRFIKTAFKCWKESCRAPIEITDLIIIVKDDHGSSY